MFLICSAVGRLLLFRFTKTKFGTEPEQVAQTPGSYTGQYLDDLLKSGVQSTATKKPAKK